jgi:DNA-binding MarR family transcriptional regulator
MHPSSATQGRTPPDNRCTCLLLRQATRRVSRFYDDRLRPAGLRTTQFSLLATLRQGDGIALGALAERMSMDRTTLSRNLGPLMQAGLVASHPDPEDQRRTPLYLTDAGRDMLRTAVPLWRDAQHALRARLGAGAVAALHWALDDTLEHLG